MRSIEIRVSGLVQGVGFRPTVWRLATALHLDGTVCNDGQGVLIQLSGKTQQIEDFLHQLPTQSPPLARIDQIQSKRLTAPLARGFQIIASQQSSVQTDVVADAATCADCLHELHDRSNRRFGYPFLNCTHCGPRFSIVKALPYDRQQTSMVCFELCTRCQAEYDDPQDRRFHAQPTACPDCGPHLWLCNTKNKQLAQRSDALKMAAEQIRAGHIIAIKGIGGFHLACDASNAAAIQRLRQRKQRPTKPLAMMAKDLQQIKQHCHLSTLEAEALQNSAAPILILEQRHSSSLPNTLAPGQKQWGFMLPHSPLHSLLLAQLEQPLVLTSGNRSREPQCIDNAAALENLGEIADLFLLHNRDIVNRIDDSVLRLMAGQLRLLRRGRGYAPERLPLPAGFAQAKPLLALGGELKNTFCLLHNGMATLSQHIGDLEELSNYNDYQHHLRLYQNLFEHNPQSLVIDSHPEYLSSKLGRSWAEEKKIDLIEVQHHHAHIAACMGENHLPRQQPAILGVVFDGLGYAANGQWWGGEFLRVDYQQAHRLAHLQATPLIGAAQAMREPWRNLFAQLNALGWEHIQAQFGQLSPLQHLQSKPLNTLQRMITHNINSPSASSMGRLFDAVAAALGLAPEVCHYEGQAAMALEAAIEPDPEQIAYPLLINTAEQPWQLQPAPLWHALLTDLQHGVSSGLMAARFHQGLINSVVQLAAKLAQHHQLQQVALSGGVLQNKTLLEGITSGLQQHGLQVLTHKHLPANDGGLAFGQALIGAARQTFVE